MTEPRKKPWLKWYPADWRAEPSLRLVGRAARSLWMDLIGLMHESERYGYLLVNGKKPSFAQLARILGDKEKDIFDLMAELKTAGVYSEEDGVIFSRRMVRDEKRSEEGRRAKVEALRDPKPKPDRYPSSPPSRVPSRGASRDPSSQDDAEPSHLEARGQKGFKPTRGLKPSGATSRASADGALAPTAAPDELRADWADECGDERWQKVKYAPWMPPREWNVYFSTGRPNGSPTSIILQSRYSAAHVNERWAEKIGDVFGEPVTFKHEPKEPLK